MKISGNQTAISEILQLLDNNYLLPFVCKCNLHSTNETHKLNCEYQDKKYEDQYGCNFYVYNIDYDGQKILSSTLIYKGYTNGNLMDGCVK